MVEHKKICVSCIKKIKKTPYIMIFMCGGCLTNPKNEISKLILKEWGMKHETDK